MERKTGTHLYINIINLVDIILDEERRLGGIRHTFHALDTYFSSIENFAKSIDGRPFEVEKITGGRLHLYSEGAPAATVEPLKKVAGYAAATAKAINKEVPKYQSLKDFKIHVGADNGKFYLFEFASDDNYSELTSIGFAANYAAKLQSIAHESQIAISKELFEAFEENGKRSFKEARNSILLKYTDNPYYVADLSSEPFSTPLTSAQKDRVKEYANRTNLTDMAAESVRAKLNFDTLSKTTYKKLEGVPFFADVRNFTKQFKDDDSNLEKMAQKTKKILTNMYYEVINLDGEHIQFQGDREMALFYDYENATDGCVKRAVLCAMRLIDTVTHNVGVSIGIGFDLGSLFAIKIGARGEKDRLLLGGTVSESDRLEDKCADENQIAISEKAWERLRTEDKGLARIFKQKDQNVYVATIGYKEYQNQLLSSDGEYGARNHSYNPAWG